MSRFIRLHLDKDIAVALFVIISACPATEQNHTLRMERLDDLPGDFFEQGVVDRRKDKLPEWWTSGQCGFDHVKKNTLIVWFVPVLERYSFFANASILATVVSSFASA